MRSTADASRVLFASCGRTSAVFLNHIWGACNWSCHQIKFMTIRCHFPRFKHHLHRPKRQVKRGAGKAVPPTSLQAVTGPRAPQLPWMEHPLITSWERGSVPFSFSSDDSSRPRVRGARLGLCKGPWRVRATGREATGWVCRPEDPPRSDSAPDFPPDDHLRPTLILGPGIFCFLRVFKPFPRKNATSETKSSHLQRSRISFFQSIRDLPWPLWGGVKGRFTACISSNAAGPIFRIPGLPFIMGSWSLNQLQSVNVTAARFPSWGPLATTRGQVDQSILATPIFLLITTQAPPCLWQ